MKKIKILMAFLCLILTQNQLFAQNINQTIRGTILDKDNKMELIGANVTILTVDPIKGVSTGLEGDFKLENIPVGRHNIEITYIGYEPLYLNSILLKSGKELVLNLEMTESAEILNEIVVKASESVDKTKALNEFASVSSRTFSVEETARYAFSAFDPARMAMNYAGVATGAGDDLSNEIVIRGNSPAGVLWRLEGIQIPNPNHFGAIGGTGGGISMLSSSTLSNSDFYTGAFPGEFGNATSGVFDLNMRKGNNEKREYSFMLGALGLEFAAEGPFSKSSKASYLINYRYSTLGALSALGLNPAGDVLPAYQDLSFKINVPTKKAGTFALFGLAGNNTAKFDLQKDSLEWINNEDGEYGFIEESTSGTVGLSHRYLLSDKSYLRTVAIASYEQTFEDEYKLDALDDYKEIKEYREDINQTTFRVSSTYHNKINAKNSLQIGGIYSAMDFNFAISQRDDELDKLVNYFDNGGNSSFVQGFGQWKHRFNNRLTLNTGLHYSLMTLNNEMALEPRASLSWKLNDRQTVSVSSGIHSKMEHLALYLLEGELDDGTVINAKKHLGLSKSIHNVIGYDHVFGPKLRLKAEVYYQHLYNIPIDRDPAQNNSLVNSTDIYSMVGIDDAVADGTAQNVGIDLTLEKFFSDQYYFLVTGALYDSKYKAADGKNYNTRFNGNYQLNLLAGKEFTVGKKKNKTFGINAKYALSGGGRYTPVDLAQSKLAGEAVYDESKRFEARSETYMRFDLGLSFRIDKKHMTHTIMLDVQNVTNRQNVYGYYFNSDANELQAYTQTGLFPNFNYRIEF